MESIGAALLIGRIDLQQRSFIPKPAQPESTMHTNAYASFAATCPGTWKINPAHAVSLTAAQDAVFKVAHGQVWLTFDGTQTGAAEADYFLQAGQQIHVSRGRRVVVESFGAAGAPAYFSWAPIEVHVAAHVATPVRQATRWQLGVAQPLLDLRHAAVLGLGATARLAVGLVAMVVYFAARLVTTRAGVSSATRTLSVQSSAQRVHSAMSATDAKACAGTP
jgi:hypothetical protein